MTRDTSSNLPPTQELLSLGVALSIVLLVVVWSYNTWTALSRSTEQLEISRRVQNATTTLLSTLKDAETGQRGYLLTGQDSYLEPYRKAVSGIAIVSAELTDAAAKRADQAVRANAIRPLVAQKLAELKQTIELRQSNDLEGALAIVKTDRGKALMDEIRQRCADIEAIAGGRMVENEKLTVSRTYELGLISTIGTAALFTLLVLATLTIQRGIAARQRLIDSTQRDRDWLQTTLDSIGDAVIATNAQGEVTLLNGVAQSLTGWTPEQAAGLALDEIFVISNEETGATVQNPVSKVISEGRIAGLANHTILTAKDGRRIPIEDSAAPIRNKNGEVAGVILVFRDVSERKNAEKGLQAMGERFRFLAESMPQKMFTATPTGDVDYFNRQWMDFTGLTFEQIEKWGWTQFIHPEDVAANVRVWKHSVETGEPFKFVHRFRRFDGAFRWHLSRALPMRDAVGTITMWIGSNTEIHEQRETEEELRRANEDLQQFAYSASHDLQEPIRNVAVYSEIISKRYGQLLDAEGQQFLGFLTGGARRLGRLIDDLLRYTRAGIDDGGMPKADATAVMEQVLLSLAESIRESAAVVTFDELPLVPIREAHLQQLCQNLIGNSIKYRSVEPPRIHVAAVDGDGAWQFSVRDNGIGIDPQYREKIFGVFKRLHHDNEYSGTGIGLAICQRVVLRYGGRIWVESEPGQGSTFSFTIPKGSTHVESAAG